MIDPPFAHPHGSLAAAGLAFVAAAGGLVAAQIDPRPAPGLYAMTPEDLTAWTKAICNNLFTIVNTVVGCYHLVTVGHATVQRRRKARTKPTPPGGPAPHTEPAGGASH